MNKHNYCKLSHLGYAMSCILPILLVALMIALPGCAEKEAPPESEIPAHFTTYTEEGLFSISYPADWETALFLIKGIEQNVKQIITNIQSDIPIERSSMIFIAGLPAETGYEPSVNIVVESLPGIIWTHDSVVEAEIRGTKAVVKDYREFSRVKITVGGRTSTLIEWEGTILDKHHLLTLFTLVGKTVWLVGCSSLPAEFSKWEDDFDAIIRSLRILK